MLKHPSDKGINNSSFRASSSVRQSHPGGLSVTISLATSLPALVKNKKKHRSITGAFINKLVYYFLFRWFCTWRC